MLIIEGADLVGKTTLQKAIVKQLWAEGFTHMPQHLTRPPKHWDSYRNYMELASFNSVWDRFHLSELIYRNNDEYPTSMTPMRWRLLDSHLKMLGAFVMVLYCSDQTLTKRWEERGDTLYPLEHILKVNADYREACSYNSLGVKSRDSLYPATIDLWADTDIEPDVLRLAQGVVAHYTKHIYRYKEAVG